MAENVASELSASWFVVEKEKEKAEEEAKEAKEEEAGEGGNEAPGAAPASLPLAEASAVSSPVATPSDGIQELSLETTSSAGGYASSEHSDFEVFEQDREDEEEEEDEAGGSTRRRHPTLVEVEPASASAASHEERIRLALHSLRGEAPLQPIPLAMEPPLPVDESLSLRQSAEPPRVQIIRLNAEEESLPESDIQLEEEQQPAPVFGQEQIEMLMEGDRVRRYQHQPNPNLNARLNSLVMCALLFVIGMAVGHFVGSTHERFSHHFERADRLDRMKSIQTELVRCAHKYDELELQLNDVKATLVQKEYVDKWESLYQEGEEEKAALTATMNLYKSRYNKQKQLLTQCEMKYQDLEEQLGTKKRRRGSSTALPPGPSDLSLCQRQLADLETRLDNCSRAEQARGVLEQLLSRLRPHLPANLSSAAADWLDAASVSANQSERFAAWLLGMRDSVNGSRMASLLRSSASQVSHNVEQLLDALVAASGGQGAKEGEEGVASVWRKALTSMRALWHSSRPAKAAPEEAATQFRKRKLSSVEAGDRDGLLARVEALEKQVSRLSPPPAHERNASGEGRPADGREQARRADWYWRRRARRTPEDEPMGEWPGAFWEMQRKMRRAQARVWTSLTRLSQRLKWWEKRKKGREAERRKTGRRRKASQRY